MLVYAQTWEMMYVYCMQFSSLYIDTLIKVWANNAFSNYKDKKSKGRAAYLPTLSSNISWNLLKKMKHRPWPLNLSLQHPFCSFLPFTTAVTGSFPGEGTKVTWKNICFSGCVWGVLFYTLALISLLNISLVVKTTFFCVCLEEVKQVISVLASRWPWPFLHPSVCRQSPCRHVL